MAGGKRHCFTRICRELREKSGKSLHRRLWTLGHGRKGVLVRRKSLSNYGKLEVMRRKDTASSFWLVLGNRDQISGLESQTKL